MSANNFPRVLVFPRFNGVVGCGTGDPNHFVTSPISHDTRRPSRCHLDRKPIDRTPVDLWVTRTCLDTPGRESGHVGCSCHNVQTGTPVDKVLAMIETVHGA